MLIALFGLVMGVTTVPYTAQTYSFFFLTQTLRVDLGTASLLMRRARRLPADDVARRCAVR